MEACMSNVTRLLIVNGHADILTEVEGLINGENQYDVVFVALTEHAYSQIKRVQPDLVIICLSFEQKAGFHLLSMLKLDPQTRDIPALTYALMEDGLYNGEEESPSGFGDNDSEFPPWLVRRVTEN
jgi:PleD family two-component response regulator